jgi:NAD(P)-dependent dehydrogenase (short-subunit alcohol dehydrogenase family)
MTAPQTALIVGVRGLGRVIALHCARRGFNVAVASRTQADVDAVAAAVTAEGGAGLPVVADLADPAACTALVETVRARFGRIDLCVAAQTSGARFGPVPLLDVAEEDLRRSLAGYPVNTLHLLQAVGRAQREQGAGTFVQIGTSSGLRVREGFAALSAAQHALRALVATAARELRGAGVHVAYLAVEGGIESERAAAYVARVGKERTLPPDEIARAVLYLHEQDARSWTHELSLRPSRSEGE